MGDIEVSKQSGVVELRLNRPEKKNAITLAMYRDLAEALRDADSDPAVRVLLLTAVGDVFCAGNDIVDFLAMNGRDLEVAPSMDFLRRLVTFGKPVVAAVHGAAVGIGATMLLHCDLVYGSETFKLSMPFVSLGLVPEAASSLLLPARVGHAVASEMLLLGAAVDAHRAIELRLLNQVAASAGELSSLARKTADELATKPPGALRASRKLLLGDREGVLARMEEEGRQVSNCLRSPEAKEAFTAFLERRPADFSKLA